MGGTIALPTWFVVLAAILAAIGLLDRLLIPSVRWVLRRRVNAVIDELNERNHLRIQPFKLNKRDSLTDRLIFDSHVINAAEDYAIENNEPRASAMERVRVYAKEIVPAFNAYAYFRVGTRLARWLTTLTYRVRFGYVDEDALKAVDPESSLVFVMNHRSNMDYVLVTYLAASSSALSYAVGEWARIWPLQTLIRAMGAYFIRRDSGDPLYRKVLSRYVHMATREGVTQAIFPEGGLSRDGKLREPKLGLLSYMVSEFDPAGSRDIVFIPIGLNYDRVLEDRSLTARFEKEAGARHWRVGFVKVVKYLGGAIYLTLRRRWYRFGYASVNFGSPISLRAHLAAGEFDFRNLDEESKFVEISKLGVRLMDAVGDIVPVLPVALAASVFVEAGAREVSRLEIKAEIFKLIKTLDDRDAHIHIPRGDRDYSVETGLRLLVLRNIVLELDSGLYRANPEETVLLTYYANSIDHLLPGRDPGP